MPPAGARDAPLQADASAVPLTAEGSESAPQNVAFAEDRGQPGSVA
jgi:hypothetical protein